MGLRHSKEQAQHGTHPKEPIYPKNGEGAYDMNNKTFLNEGNHGKAFKVTRLYDKFECVTTILNPCIAGMD
jgi:hypothetical protein